MGFEAIKGYFKRNRMFYLFVAPLFGTYRNHIMASKSPKQKRNLRHAGFVDSTEVKKMKKLIPYK